MINIHRTDDKNLIRSVMMHPEIFNTVAEDGQIDFDVDVNECWLALTNDQLLGVYNLHPLNGVTLELHAQMLPEYRKEYTRECAIKVWKWILNECPDQYQKIVAIIPVIYPNVRDFALEFGLNDEGLNRKSYLKDGNIVDQWMMGITMNEIQEYVNNHE